MQQQVISGTTGGNVYTYGGGGAGGELNPNSEYFVVICTRTKITEFILEGEV